MYNQKLITNKHANVHTVRAVNQRDGGLCAICSNDGTDLHHIKPRGAGGTDKQFNLITLCRECHELAHQHEEETEQRIIEYMADYYRTPYTMWDESGYLVTADF